MKPLKSLNLLKEIQINHQTIIIATIILIITIIRIITIISQHMKQLIMITIKKIILTTILFPKMTSITIQIYTKIPICKIIYNYF